MFMMASKARAMQGESIASPSKLGAGPSHEGPRRKRARVEAVNEVAVAAQVNKGEVNDAGLDGIKSDDSKTEKRKKEVEAHNK